MNKYRFALLRYLMGAINSVSPNAEIQNDSLHYDVNKTARKVYGLDIKALANKLAADGWECTLVDRYLEATAIRNDFDCSLKLRFNGTYWGICTWAYKKSKK